MTGSDSANVSTHPYMRLRVWRRGMRLLRDVYALTRELPAEERYGISAQLRRATLSIPCNIAEGSSRGSVRDFARFIEIALGSVREVETLVFASVMVGLTNADTVAPLQRELAIIGRQLLALRRNRRNIAVPSQ